MLPGAIAFCCSVRGSIYPVLMNTERNDLPYGPYQPVGRSAMVERVMLLPRPVRKVLGANDYIIAAVDSLVTFCAIVLEESDAPLPQRLIDGQSEFAALQEPPEWITAAVSEITDTELADWAKRLQHADRKKVLNRLLGTATFTQLRQDMTADARVVLTALRVGVSFIRPWALAMDDSLNVLTQAQKDEVGVPRALVASLFGIVLNFEELLGVALADEIGLKFPSESEKPFLTEIEIQTAMQQLRKLVRASADENLTDLSEVFSRKMRGARDALDFSVDGVSQAANSLVELIDRIAREAFTEDEVATWLQDNGLFDEHHTYEAEKKRRPTKRSQLMCLAWAGSQIVASEVDPINLQKIAALSLLNVRDSLQKLKHSDKDTADERALLTQYLGTIEGTIMLMVKVCWITAGRERVQVMRQQFSS